MELRVQQIGPFLAIGALLMDARIAYHPIFAASDPESRIIIHAPPKHQAVAHLLEQASPVILQTLHEKASLSLRQPVSVYLALSEEEMERLAPPEVRWPRWAVGFAFGNSNRVILRTADLDFLGNQGVLQVFTHEMSHILLHQLESQPVPRWFDEGLALWLANEWAFTDSYTYSYLLLTEGYIPLEELNVAFPTNEQRARMAYMESLSFLSSVVESYGEEVVPTIVNGLAEGLSFQNAFEQATGLLPGELEAQWRRSVHILYKWVPFLTSSAFLWMVITGLFAFGYLKKKRRERAMIRRWEEEEEYQNSSWSKEGIH